MPSRCRIAVIAFVGGLIGWLPAVPGDAQPAPPPGLVADRAARDLATPPERRAAYYRRHLTDVYRRHGRHDDRWHAQAIRLLDGFSAHHAYRDHPNVPHPRPIPTLADLRDQREKILERGCDDPLVKYIGAILDPARDTSWRNEDWQLEQAMIQSAVDDHDPHRYTVTLICTERMLLRDHLAGNNPDQNWANQNRLAVVNNYYASLFAPDRRFHPGDDAELADLFKWYADDHDVKLAADFMLATDPAPDDRQWLAHTLRGILYVDTAWVVRGGGWARTVEDDQWRKFAVYLALAQQEYEAAWALEPGRAEPAVGMIAVAMGQSSGQEPLWFDRALAADPHTEDAYSSMQWACRKRWGGDADQLLQIARRALDSEAYHTGVPDRFDEALDDLMDDYGSGWLVLNADLVWPMLERYLDGRAAQPTPRRSADWCWSQGFKLAHRSRRPAAMWDYFARLDRDADRLVGPYSVGLDRRWSIGQLLAEQDPRAQAACLVADTWSNGGRYDLAAEVINRTLPQIEDPVVRQHFADRLRIYDWQQRLAGHGWVDLFEHGLEGWRPTRGRFAAEEEKITGVYDSTNGRGGLRMVCAMDPGTRYVAELTVELPEGYHGRHWGGVGFLLDPRIGRRSSRSVMITAARSTRSGGVWIRDPNNDDDDDHWRGQPDDRRLVTLRLERWDQTIRVTLNGVVAEETYELNDPWPSDGGLGVGAWHTSHGQRYKFKSCRIRTLAVSPFEDKPGGGLVMR